MTTESNRTLNHALWLGALGMLWFSICRQLSPMWQLFEQYNYGWGVPFLCAYLLWERWPTRPAPDAPTHPRLAWAGLAAVAIVLTLARVAHEANTTWRITAWLLGGGGVAITLGGIYLAAGARWVKFFAFPIAFFLVAVPWPSRLELALTQQLMRWNVAATVETLTFAGTPAMQHGNVIEVSTGPVGIDEACSGIRSLQATLMIALFFGELYRFGWRRRLGLVGIGAGLAFLFNLGRTFLLVSIAARQGLPAMEKWHDPAGIAILVGCFTGLWAAAVWLKRKTPSPVAAHPTPTTRVAVPAGFSAAVLLWVGSAEVGSEVWYRLHERHAKNLPDWTVNWPKTSRQFAPIELPPRALDVLRFDEGQAFTWVDDASWRWQMFYFRWYPAATLMGRTKLQATKSHRPDVCLPAAGWTQREDLGVKMFAAGGVELPFRRFVFEAQAGRIFYVFYSFWEEAEGAPGQSQMLDNPASRWAAARAGIRGVGTRIVNVAVNGATNQVQAEAAFAELLPKIISPVPRGN